MPNLNGPAELNGGANVYDRVICYDSPVAYDTGEFAPPTERTLGELKNELRTRLGFIAPIAAASKTYAELIDRIYVRIGGIELRDQVVKNAGQIRIAILQRLGFSAQAESPPEGMNALILGAINDAQDTIYERYAQQLYPDAVINTISSDSDNTVVHGHAVQLLALANMGAHYNRQWASLAEKRYETYINELVQRSPVGLKNRIRNAIEAAQLEIYRRYAYEAYGAVTIPPYVDDNTLVVVDWPLVEQYVIAELMTSISMPGAQAMAQKVERTLQELEKRYPPGLIENITSCLQSAQEQLYWDYEVLRTERWWTWEMVAGQNFYDIPVDCSKYLEARKITWSGCSDIDGSPSGAEQWWPIHYGIDPTLYSGPVQGRPFRYEIGQLIQVWPIPDAPYLLRLKGHMGIKNFVEDTDLTTLDSRVVFLVALANLKNHYKQQDAGAIAKQAERMLGGLAAGTHVNKRYIPGADVRTNAVQPRMDVFEQ